MTTRAALRDKPVVINGTRIVRIRNDYPELGLGYRLHMFIVTDLYNRKRLGERHISRQNAAKWVTEQGWRYIGTQEPE